MNIDAIKNNLVTCPICQGWIVFAERKDYIYFRCDKDNYHFEIQILAKEYDGLVNDCNYLYFNNNLFYEAITEPLDGDRRPLVEKIIGECQRSSGEKLAKFIYSKIKTYLVFK